MSQAQYQVCIRKEANKFSSAHMTVFPDGTKEALHGHGYTTNIHIELKNFALQDLVPFSAFKNSIRETCAEWDEKVLLAQHCPFFEVRSLSEYEIEFLLCKKRYILPREEVVLLPIENITSESLAQEFCRLLLQKFNLWIQLGKVTGLQVCIEESPGLGAIYSWHATEDRSDCHPKRT